VIGIAVGAGLSLLLSRVIANLLFGISPHDPVTYLSVSVLLGATALVACVLPARQALRIDVISALRAE
jgi:putative ABC transport system permease protein